MHLISVRDDSLDVYEGDERVGEITLMADGWAAYGITATGRIQDRRIGTYDSVKLALIALKGGEAN